MKAEISLAIADHGRASQRRVMAIVDDLLPLLTPGVRARRRSPRLSRREALRIKAEGGLVRGRG